MKITSSRRHHRHAFTLIELLVVVLILGILLAVAIPLYLSSTRNAAQQTVKANLKTIAMAAQSYRVKNGAYPTKMKDFVGAGLDLEAEPQGPKGITYSWDIKKNPPLVVATENGSDVFGSATATDDTADYNLSTGQYSGFDTAATGNKNGNGGSNGGGKK